MKDPPAVRETCVRSPGWEDPGWEDPLEKGKTTHPNVLAYGLYHRKSDMTEQLSINYSERKKRKTPISRSTPAFLVYKVLIVTPLKSQVCL